MLELIIRFLLLLAFSHAVKLPVGSISWQDNSIGCAIGWETIVDSRTGLAILSSSENVGRVVGTQLQALTPPTHDHTVGALNPATVNGDSLRTQTKGGTAGSLAMPEINNKLTTNSNNGNTGVKESGIELVQLRLCKLTTSHYSVPSNTIVFFDEDAGGQCPLGFTQMNSTDGRFIVPASEAVASSKTPGLGRENPEQSMDTSITGNLPKHSHNLQVTYSLDQYCRAGGSGSNTYIDDGTQIFTGVSGESTIGLPYIQLLTCVADNDNDVENFPPPLTMEMFTTGNTCPGGLAWEKSSTSWDGRIPTGLRQSSPAQDCGLTYPNTNSGLSYANDVTPVGPPSHFHTITDHAFTLPRRNRANTGWSCGVSPPVRVANPKTYYQTFNSDGDQSELLPYSALLMCHPSVTDFLGPLNCDFTCYKNQNPDLVTSCTNSAWPCTDAELQNHFVLFGHIEGRQCSCPTTDPTESPTNNPSSSPSTLAPTIGPTSTPTANPVAPTKTPTMSPISPTNAPNTPQPSESPITSQPTSSPITFQPTSSPITSRPTSSPVPATAGTNDALGLPIELIAGVGAGGLVVLLAVFFLYKRKKQGQRRRASKLLEGEPYKSSKKNRDEELFDSLFVTGTTFPFASPEAQDAKKSIDDSSKTPVKPKAEATTSISTDLEQPRTEVVVVFDFQAENDDELSASVGDKLLILENVNEDWIVALNQDTGKSGMLPSSYIS